MFEIIKNFIKKNKLLYIPSKPLKDFIVKSLNFIKRNRSLLFIKSSSYNYKNIFILDARVHAMTFDSFFLLIRGSNFFYNDKWSVIIYEDNFHRNGGKKLPYEIYLNNLVNIFLQSLLILPNPPTSIKFVKSSHELLRIIKNSKKMFPENYSFLSGDTKHCTMNNFNEKDFQNFKSNQPILKASDYHSNIFDNFINYRGIKKYITITFRNKDWNKDHWNTNLDDINLYLDFIKKNNLSDYDILMIPDTQQDISKDIINLIEKNNLKFYIFHHGSFSIPMRFLAYSKASFNFSSTNGSASILLFIKNNTFFILKDPNQADDLEVFVKKFNRDIFLDRNFICIKKLSLKPTP